jgi:hypothetical protein
VPISGRSNRSVRLSQCSTQLGTETPTDCLRNYEASEKAIIWPITHRLRKERGTSLLSNESVEEYARSIQVTFERHGEL